MQTKPDTKGALIRTKKTREKKTKKVNQKERRNKTTKIVRKYKTPPLCPPSIYICTSNHFIIILCMFIKRAM